MAMTQRPGRPVSGRPAKGKRDRDGDRSGAASPSRRPKPGFAGSGAKGSGAKNFGAKSFGAKGSGTKSFGAGKRDEAGGGRPRFRDKRTGESDAGFRAGRGAGMSAARPRSRAPDRSPQEGGERKRHRPVDAPPSHGGRERGGRDHGERDHGGQDENRIAKVMARAGLCSRREAEDWIAAGRVAVNGGTISSPAINVKERDRVTVDGEPLPRAERTRLFLYHKPAGLVSTNADPEGRPTLFDALPKNLPRLMSVGRLDIGTEGLLLLTNDGGLARELELPETAWVRRYRVRAHGHVSQDDLDKLRDGVTVEGIHYGPVEATLERDQGANIWISFAIREGKNREVRNVLAHLGLAVNRLIRVEFGPFGLGSLPEGAVEEVETGNLRTQLGPRIVARAGCDFSGPAARAGQSREERREQRHVLHERLRDGWRGPRDAERDGDRDGVREDRRPRRQSGGEWDEAPEKPPGRPRRGHAWRQDDAPVHRTYRGSRREDLKIADVDRPDKRTGLTADRKGRSVLVERFGTPKEKPEAAEAPARGRPLRRGPPRDRMSGPRPSRPRFDDERADGAGRRGDDSGGPARPRKSGPRTEGRRDGQPGQRGPRPHGERDGKPGQRGPRPYGQRDGKPGGKSPGKSSGPRPHGPRGAGPRPSGRPPRKG
jgi:23S rRNA pseudouridine2605 synthase